MIQYSRLTLSMQNVSRETAEIFIHCFHSWSPARTRCDTHHTRQYIGQLEYPFIVGLQPEPDVTHCTRQYIGQLEYPFIVGLQPEPDVTHCTRQYIGQLEYSCFASTHRIYTTLVAKTLGL